MALIEMKYCMAHGNQDHMNDKCPECMRVEFELKAQNARDLKNQFMAMTPDAQIEWLFDKWAG